MRDCWSFINTGALPWTQKAIVAVLLDPTFSMSEADTKQVAHALQIRRDVLAQLAAHTFAVKSHVAFEARGQVRFGVVTKVNWKTVTVRTKQGNRRVQGNLLRAATVEEIQVFTTPAAATQGEE